MFLNKKKIFLLINISLVLFSLIFNYANSEEKGSIIGIAKVIDGDTIKINDKKIRLFGIDAPEIKQFCKKPYLSISFLSFQKKYSCGIKSTNNLKRMIKSNNIDCKIKGIDRYKRIIGECYKNKTNINSWMVRNGYAVAYTKYSKKFVAQQNLAKKEKLGIWVGSFEMPWDWRKKYK